MELLCDQADRNRFFYTLIHKMGVVVTPCYSKSVFVAVDEHNLTGKGRTSSVPNYVQVPREGTFEFTYKSRHVRVTISPEADITTTHYIGGRDDGEDIARMTRTVFSCTDNEVVLKLISDVRSHKKPGTTQLFSQRGWDWMDRGDISASLDSLFYPSDINITRSIDAFLSKRARFERFNRPFRRTYLLEGPPGTGKTSLIRAVAKHYERNLYMLDMSDPNINEAVISLLSRVPPDSVIALEDLDRYFKDSETTTNTTMNLSVLLNAIDGVMSCANGTIIFVTANNPDRLPNVLTRSGRVDEVVHFDGSVSRDQFDRACRTVGEIEPEDALFEIVRVQKLTMADVMEVLFSGDTPADRLKIARGIKRSRNFMSDLSMFT
jgi:hypothetical protein